MRQLPRSLALVAAMLLLSACGPRDRFEIRGLRTAVTDTESATRFQHEAMILTRGRGDAAERPYLVLLRLERISGGDPAVINELPNPRYTAVMVVNGEGRLTEYAGYRTKATAYSAGETWEAERVVVTIMGYVPFRTP